MKTTQTVIKMQRRRLKINANRKKLKIINREERYQKIYSILQCKLY